MIRLQDAWARTAGVRGHKPWRTVWMRVWSMEHGQTTVARKSLAREHRARSSRDHVPVIATKIYFTSYNIQNQLASHIDHKRLRGFALKPCILKEGQLYPRGNFVMGGLYVWEADICKV